LCSVKSFLHQDVTGTKIVEWRAMAARFGKWFSLPKFCLHLFYWWANPIHGPTYKIRINGCFLIFVLPRAEGSRSNCRNASFESSRHGLWTGQLDHVRANIFI
jgi:hypothetical protein